MLHYETIDIRDNLLMVLVRLIVWVVECIYKMETKNYIK